MQLGRLLHLTGGIHHIVSDEAAWWADPRAFVVQERASNGRIVKHTTSLEYCRHRLPYAPPAQSMGADTWVNLVPSAPKAAKPGTPPKPSTPTEGRRTDRVTTKDFGWFWITKRNTSCSESRAFPASRPFIERSSFEPGSPDHGAVRPSHDTGVALSRSPSGDSWLEVTREPASSEDLSDAEDGTLVAIAPRHEPRVRPLRLSSASAAVPQGPAAPTLETMCQPGACKVPSKGVRHRSGADAAASSSGTLHVGEGAERHACADDAAAAPLRDKAAAGPPARTSTVVCGVNTDSDLLWTFLAGMMLYFMSA